MKKSSSSPSYTNPYSHIYTTNNHNDDDNSINTIDTFTSSVRTSFKNIFDSDLSKKYHYQRHKNEEYFLSSNNKNSQYNASISSHPSSSSTSSNKKKNILYPTKDISYLSDEVIKNKTKKEIHSKWFHEDSIYKMRR